MQFCDFYIPKRGETSVVPGKTILALISYQYYVYFVISNKTQELVSLSGLK